MLLEKVRQTINAFKMLKRGDRVLVAVSGGPDSSTLLHLLNQLKDEFQLTLWALTVDHQIRAGSQMDVETVKSLAGGLGVPLTVERVDVPAFARSARLGLEEAGREKRYQIFSRRAAELGANRVALGHTADDRVETLLINLLRGAGSRGLGGIPPVRDQYVRPLIELWREEIESHVLENKLEVVIDETNFSAEYLRNRVRGMLIPELLKYNPRVKEALYQAARLLTDEHAYLKEAACRYVKIALSGEVFFRAPKVIALPPALQREIIRQAYGKARGGLTALGYDHVEAVREQLKASGGWELNLPGSVTVTRAGREVFFKEV